MIRGKYSALGFVAVRCHDIISPCVRRTLDRAGMRAQRIHRTRNHTRIITVAVAAAQASADRVRVLGQLGHGAKQRRLNGRVAQSVGLCGARAAMMYQNANKKEALKNEKVSRPNIFLTFWMQNIEKSSDIPPRNLS